MTKQQVERWLVMALAVGLLCGRAVGQQKTPPEKSSPEKKAEVRVPRDDQPQPQPPGDLNRRQRGADDLELFNRPPGDDPQGRGDRPAPGAPQPRRPGGRGPEGPGMFGGQPPMTRDGRGPRDGGNFGPPQGPGGMMFGVSPEDRLRGMKESDPEMYELESKDLDLERQTEEMSQQLRRAPRDQRDALKKQLQELVLKHFDARQARRDLQLKRLESDLERMRDSMKKRTEMRDQIIGKRVAELAGEQNDFDF